MVEGSKEDATGHPHCSARAVVTSCSVAKPSFLDPLADFPVAGTALGFEGGADFQVGKFAAGDHEEPEGNAVRWLPRWGHDAQTGELAGESGLQALGPAIENALEESAIGAASVAEALPDGL